MSINRLNKQISFGKLDLNRITAITYKQILPHVVYDMWHVCPSGISIAYTNIYSRNVYASAHTHTYILDEHVAYTIVLYNSTVRVGLVK